MPTLSPSTTHQESVSTYLLYNRWAATYDTDHNPLQILDSALIPSLLKAMFLTASEAQDNITITELGCGTGRNTMPFLASPFSEKISKSTLLISRPQCLRLPGPVAASAFRKMIAMSPPSNSTSSMRLILKQIPGLQNQSKDKRTW
ncbi:hypothetical protein EAE96_004706 [Botrytis aclada]|nr:hypothetical protein EAE96_004706 [Botrytis aclada]